MKRKLLILFVLIIILTTSSCFEPSLPPVRNGYGMTINEALYDLQYGNNTNRVLEKDLYGTFFNLKNPYYDSQSIPTENGFYRIGSISQYRKNNNIYFSAEDSKFDFLMHSYSHPMYKYNSEEKCFINFEINVEDIVLDNLENYEIRYDIKYEHKHSSQNDESSSRICFPSVNYYVYFDFKDSSYYIGYFKNTSFPILLSSDEYYNFEQNHDNASEEVKYYLNIMEQEFQRFLNNAEIIKIKLEK